MTENSAESTNASSTERRVTDITNLGGGIMTDEVGVVTGDLTLVTVLDSHGKVTLLVQYKDAEEWYTVTGGTCQVADRADLDAVHSIAIGLLSRPDG